jgi:diadenosine tetraphosphate (Ap4A) HIT family hydrolase
MARNRRREALPAEVDGECVFCGITDRRVDSSLVTQDDRTMAFLDLQPATPGHTLVVPRAHASALAELDPDDGAAIWATGLRVAAALRACGLAEGINFFLADGVAAGQEVWHVHLHVLPRTPSDGVRLSADWRRPTRDVLNVTAARVRSAVI